MNIPEALKLLRAHFHSRNHRKNPELKAAMKLAYGALLFIMVARIAKPGSVPLKLYGEGKGLPK